MIETLLSGNASNNTSVIQIDNWDNQFTGGGLISTSAGIEFSTGSDFGYLLLSHNHGMPKIASDDVDITMQFTLNRMISGGYLALLGDYQQGQDYNSWAVFISPNSISIQSNNAVTASAPLTTVGKPVELKIELRSNALVVFIDGVMVSSASMVISDSGRPLVIGTYRNGVGTLIQDDPTYANRTPWVLHGLTIRKV